MEKFDYSKIKPISEHIEPFKRMSAVHYGFHGYFTTQPYNVVQQYIQNFSKPGDLVADPFVGAGVTAVEALRLKRKAFALELNPFAIFLTKAKCSYADFKKLHEMYGMVLKKIEKKCEKVEKLPNAEANKLKIPYWYPKDVSLPSNADVKYLHQIFTNKQLYQLSLIKHEIDKLPNSAEKDLLLVTFCGALSRANLAYDLPADGRSVFSGQFTIFSTGRYRIPPKRIVEIPVLPVFKRRFKRIVKAKEETNPSFKNYVNKDTFKAVVGSATDLKPFLKDKSIDYIYTDPPYGGHIAYLDLSIVYNAWLGFEVTEDMKEKEVIEGGEVGHTKEDYMSLLRDSFKEMARVLKPGRWMSLVFHHREPSLWTNIVETAKIVGLEYKNSVVQHTKLPSWHKIDVPQSVLSSQMIINFIRKSRAHFAFIEDQPSLSRLILNVAEREIIKRHGATFEEIVNELVPELFEHGLIHEEAQTKTDKIFRLLAEEFDYNDETKTFQIKKGRHKKLGNYISLQDRLRYYLISYMRKVKRATLEEIIPALLPKLINGETPSGQEILEELKKIARFDGNYWIFVTGDFQPSFDFEAPSPKKIKAEIPNKLTRHNKTIYMLALLAAKYSLIPKIGHQEQKEPFLKAVSQAPELKFNNVSKKDNKNINNIDCLWLPEKSNKPILAFEVERTTETIMAFERFLALLKAVPDVGHQRRLVLVIPRKNKGKFDTKIRYSSYAGAPHYINNKLRYIFEEDLIAKFNELMKESDFTKLEGILSSPEPG